jgi:hypothetical protein
MSRRPLPVAAPQFARQRLQSGCNQTVSKSAGTGFPVEEGFFDSFLILKR